MSNLSFLIKKYKSDKQKDKTEVHYQIEEDDDEDEDWDEEEDEFYDQDGDLLDSNVDKKGKDGGEGGGKERCCCKVEFGDGTGELANTIQESHILDNEELDMFKGRVFGDMDKSKLDFQKLVVYCLEDCAPGSKSVRPPLKALQSMDELFEMLNQWEENSEIYKGNQFVLLMEKATEELGKLSPSNDADLFAQQCALVWKLLLSKQSRICHIFETLMDRILQILLPLIKFETYWDLDGEVQTNLLGALWAATTHIEVRKQLVRESSNSVLHLLQNLNEYVERYSFKNDSEGMECLMGLLVNLIGDGTLELELKSKEFVRTIELLLDMVRRSRESGNIFYLNCTSSLLVHLLHMDNARSLKHWVQSYLVEVLFIKLDFEEGGALSEAYLLALTTMVLSTTIRKSFCVKLLNMGIIDTTGKFISWILKNGEDLLKTEKRLHHRHKLTDGSMNWQGYLRSKEYKTVNYKPNEMLLEAILRSIAVVWKCLQVRGNVAKFEFNHLCSKEHSMHCNLFQVHEVHGAESESESESEDKDDDVDDDEDDEDDEREDKDNNYKDKSKRNENDQKENSTKNNKNKTKRIVIDKFEKDNILKLVKSLVSLFRIRTIQEFGGLNDPIVDEIIDSIQASALGLLSFMLTEANMGEILLSSSILLTFTSELSQIFLQANVSENEHIMFGSKKGGKRKGKKYLIIGRSSMLNAWEFLRSFLALSDVSADILSSESQQQIILDDDHQKKYFARTVQFSKQFIVPYLNLEDLVQHLRNVAIRLQNSDPATTSHFDMGNPNRVDETTTFEEKNNNRMKLTAQGIIQRKREMIYEPLLKQVQKRNSSMLIHMFAKEKGTFRDAAARGTKRSLMLLSGDDFSSTNLLHSRATQTKALQTVHRFLHRVHDTVAHQKEIRIFNSQVAPLLNACAHLDGVLDRDFMQCFVQLSNAIHAKEQFYHAMWHLARNKSNRTMMGQLGLIEQLCDFISHYEIQIDSNGNTKNCKMTKDCGMVLRAVELLWLLLYDSSNLILMCEKSGIIPITERLKRMLNMPSNVPKRDRIIFVLVQILRLLANCATDPSFKSLHKQIGSHDLIEMVWNCVYEEFHDSRIPCMASSLFLMLPIREELAERATIAMIRIFIERGILALQSKEKENKSRYMQILTMCHAANMFGHVQFSIEGHKLLLEVEIPRMLLSVATRFEVTAETKPCECELTPNNNKCEPCLLELQTTSALLGLANVTTSGPTQRLICEEGLHDLIYLGWTTENVHQRIFIERIIKNLCTNDGNQTMIYDLELKLKKEIASEEPGKISNPIMISDQKQQKKNNDVDDKKKRNEFLRWFQEMISTLPKETNTWEPAVDTAAAAAAASNEEENNARDGRNEKLSKLIGPLIRKQKNQELSKSASSSSSTFWQEMRKSKQELWVRETETSKLAKKNSVRGRWNPPILNIKMNNARDKSIVRLADSFPHERFAFSQNQLNQDPLSFLTTPKERERLGICSVSSFKHVPGSKVYKELDMSTYHVTNNNNNNQEDDDHLSGAKKTKNKNRKRKSMYLYRSGGFQLPKDLIRSHIEDFGTPAPPTRLIDLDLCSTSLGDGWYKRFKVNELVDFDLIPVPFDPPHPENLEKFDKELEKSTIFPLFISKPRASRRKGLSMNKIKKILLLERRKSSKLSFQALENCSMFANRKFESDSLQLMSVTDTLARHAFEKDWETCMQKKSFKSYIYSIAARDSSNTGDQDSQVPAVLRRIQNHLGAHYGTICNLYRFYSSQTIIPISTTKGDMVQPKLSELECMSEEMMFQFAKDINVYNKNARHCSRDGLKRITQTIFGRGIPDKDLSKVQRQASRRCKAIRFGRMYGVQRFGFLEYIIRLADARFVREDKLSNGLPPEERNLVGGIKEIIKTHIGPLMGKESCCVDPDIYRRERIHQVEVNEILESGRTVLEQLYDMFSGVSKNTRQWGGFKGKRMTLNEWLALLDYVGVYTPWFTFREASVIFKASIYEVVDVPQDWERQLTLTFTGFVEAMARAADAFFLPSEKYLLNLNFSDIVSFYRFMGRLNAWNFIEKVENEGINEHTKLSNWKKRHENLGLNLIDKSTRKTPVVVKLFYKLKHFMKIVKTHEAISEATFNEYEFWFGIHPKQQQETKAFEICVAEELAQIILEKEKEKGKHENQTEEEENDDEDDDEKKSTHQEESKQQFYQLSKNEKLTYILEVREPCQVIREDYFAMKKTHSQKQFANYIINEQYLSQKGQSPEYPNKICSFQDVLIIAANVYQEHVKRVNQARITAFMNNKKLRKKKTKI